MSILKLDQTMNVLNDVNSIKESWNVFVRVLRLWCVQDFMKQKISFSLETGLQDEQVSFS